MTTDAPYRIWTRYSHDEWQRFPELYVNERHAHQGAEAYQQGAPLHTFLVLPEGVQPPPDEPFRPGPPEIVRF